MNLFDSHLLKDFERSRAFTFLSEVKKRFQTTYGSRAQTALPYAMNSEFSSTLAAQMVCMMKSWMYQATFPVTALWCPNISVV